LSQPSVGLRENPPDGAVAVFASPSTSNVDARQERQQTKSCYNSQRHQKACDCRREIHKKFPPQRYEINTARDDLARSTETGCRSRRCKSAKFLRCDGPHIQDGGSLVEFANTAKKMKERVISSLRCCHASCSRSSDRGLSTLR